MSFVWPQNKYTLNELISRAHGHLCFEGLVEKLLPSLEIIQGVWERERWSINPTLGSYTALTPRRTCHKKATFYMEKQQWEYIIVFFICLMRLSKREKHEAGTLCRPLNSWRTQWSEKTYKEMRVPADQRVKNTNYRNDALVSERWNYTNRSTDQNIIGLPCLLKCTPNRWTTFS